MRERLIGQLGRLEEEIGGPWFREPSLVLSTLPLRPPFAIWMCSVRAPDLSSWSIFSDVHMGGRLEQRPSVRNAVDADYADRLVRLVVKGILAGRRLEATQIDA